MARHSRRDFMGLSGAGMAGLVGASWPIGRALAAVDTAAPDLIVVNAKVYTVDPLTPRAQAFAIKAGRFIAIGSSDEIKALAGKRTQTIDAKQMTIVPGFIDAHNHAPGTILLYEVLVGNPYDVEFVTIASIVDKLRARARETPPGTLGRGLLLRRHQGAGQARAQHSRPRPGVERASGGGASPRRPHLLLQQQGLRPRRRHQDDARTGRAAPSTVTGTASLTAESPTARGSCSTASASGRPTPRTKPGDATAMPPAFISKTVRPLRLNQRAPRGRRPVRPAGDARTRRASASGQLRGQRRCARSDDQERHRDRIRR